MEPDDYRAKAAEMKALAARTAAEELRTQYLAMAAAWEDLADTAEALASRSSTHPDKAG